MLDEIASADELPHGWTAEHEAASYRLERRDDEQVFGWRAVGPHSWKQELYPARVRLWRASAQANGDPGIEDEAPPRGPLALLGARSCDLHAIATQDRVFLGGRYVERDYAQRREGAFVAVNCSVPNGTCFCASMGTGPRALGGYDLALTEVTDGDHRFLVEVGTERGREILDALETREATDEDISAALAVTDEAARPG